MIEIRFHGRGGQGTVVAAKILAYAAARENLFIQAFPEFGVERRGAPVCAYIRAAREHIYERGRIETPDHVMVLDPTLLDSSDIIEGLKPNGWLVLNSRVPPESYKKRFRDFRIATVDANSIALSHKLGSKFAPFVNSAMLGAFARAIPFVSLETIKETIHDLTPNKKEENVTAAEEAYNSLTRTAQAEEVWADK